MKNHAIVYMLQLLRSALLLTVRGGDFDEMFDVLVRLWCRCLELEHPHALMTTAAAAVAAQAQAIAFEASGSRPTDWSSALSARVAELGDAPPADVLAAAVMALGEHRPAWRRFDEARADSALTVAAAALALGARWVDLRPAPAFKRFSEGPLPTGAP